MNQSFLRNDIDFPSQKTRCSAWLYLPHSDEKRPVIVMAHGLGGVRDMRLDVYAERFAMAGYACFLFDYRNMGASDGTKRQRINVKEQLEDWNNAIDFIKKSGWIDSKRIFLFGSSFSGGHVITLSAKRKDLTAVIAQCPYTSTLATAGALPIKSALKMISLCMADLFSCLGGYHPVMIKLAGAPGGAALMAVPDYKLYLNQAGADSLFENKTPARAALEFFKYAPGLSAKQAQNPIYFGVCLKDTITPAKATLRYAKQAASATIGTYDCGHFDIYIGKDFEGAILDYIKFLDSFSGKTTLISSAV